ncbi:glycosyltransferase [Actinosynnema sp. NPDC023587]|uniref:glycosyltransferase n=1 Tax=Actinosynnema sp. NPDC023587 TaxID=3154695 RepID=UPI0033FF0A53
MRLLFASLAHHGHVFPLVPLAVAAVRAGHRVGYATGGALHPVLARTGLEPVRVGPTLPEAFERVGGGDFGERVRRGELSPDQIAVHVAEVFGSVLPRRFLADLEPVLARFRPDLVVYDAVCVGAGAAAGRAGVPAVAHGLGHRDLTALTPEYVARVGEFAAEAGVAPPAGARTPLGHTYLDVYPPSMQDPDFVAHADRIVLRPVAFAPPGAAPPRLRLADRRRPLVYLTLGTEAGADDGHGVLRAAIDGLSTLDADVLVATGPKLAVADIGPVAANVLLEQWVPQARLLPHLDLAVHHAGAGTTLAALGAAVPQLVLPRAADQFVNAGALLAAGAAERLLPHQVSASAVAAAADRLLTGVSVRLAAERIAAEIATMPSPEAVAAILPGLARQPPGRTDRV